MFTLCKPVCCMLAAGLLLLASAALAGEDPFGPSTEDPFAPAPESKDEQRPQPTEDPFGPFGSSEEPKATKAEKKAAKKRAKKNRGEAVPADPFAQPERPAKKQGDSESEKMRSSRTDAQLEDEPGERKIRSALKDTTEIDVFKTPLSEIALYFSDQHDIPIVLDERALAEVGLGGDTPMTKNVEGVTLDSALRHLLREVELAHVVTDESLLITTKEKAGRLRESDSGVQPANEQTDPELEQMRSSLADAERESERRKMKIRVALQESTELDFFRTPLNEVARFLSDYHEIPILLDENALTDMGLGSDTPLTSTVKGISLDSALRQLLREVELSHVIADEVLLITTEQQARRLNDPAVYDVAGLASDAESLERLAKTIDAVLGGDATVVAVNGRLIVAGTLGEQQRAKRLVEKLRGKPQKE